jgi:hypothetical protein
VKNLDKFDIKAATESPESKQVLEKAQSTLAKSGITGTILYCGPSGSNLHGRHQKGSFHLPLYYLVIFLSFCCLMFIILIFYSFYR